MPNVLKVNPSATAQQFLQTAGVPVGLLRPFSLDLRRQLTPYSIGSKQVRAVGVAQQIDGLEKMCRSAQPFVGMIVSRDNYQQARQLATVIFWSHLQRALNFGRGQLPLWHTPSGSFRHSLLEDYRQGEHSAPLLLALDNIYQDMPAIKVDKVTELLQVLCERPRLLIFRGSKPLQYCVETLGVRPNVILQLGSLSKKIIQF